MIPLRFWKKTLRFQFSLTGKWSHTLTTWSEYSSPKIWPPLSATSLLFPGKRARLSGPDFESEDKSFIGANTFSLEPYVFLKNVTWLLSMCKHWFLSWKFTVSSLLPNLCPCLYFASPLSEPYAQWDMKRNAPWANRKMTGWNPVVIPRSWQRLSWRS